MTARTVEVILNERRLSCEVEPHLTLLRFLREQVGVTEVKYGCGEGVCGSCTVILDGVAVNSCSVLALQADGATIQTVAGLTDGALHPLQQEFVQHGGVQCGFCTPGMVLGALEAVQLGLAEDRTTLRAALAGNLCRCTGYRSILDAVQAYAQGEA